MTIMNEVKKFEILTDINNHKSTYATMTTAEIQTYIQKKFNIQMSLRSLRNWSKLYGFTYKAQNKPAKLNQAEAIKRTNQRIRILGMVMRNLCKQLDITHPTMLDKLIDGVTEQYGAASCFDNNTQELEDKVCESI